MELVRGLAITAYADLQKLSLRERLVLVKHVCEAVHHAHGKGVGHQGLRPSSIIMALNGHPKVIGFGIAKALHEAFSKDSKPALADLGNGTPSCMNSEHSVPGEQNVDVWADIHALGVVLFEMLVGEMPNEASEILENGRSELSELHQSYILTKPCFFVFETFRERITNASSLNASRLPKDLDWIVLKALELDPKKRYRSARELADDLAHHLNDEPVTARPPKLTYRLWNFLKRCRFVG